MPPKFLPLSRMTARAKNRHTHPGLVDLPSPHRTPAEVKEARQAAAAKEAAAEEELETAVNKVAYIEDKLRRQDEECEIEHQQRVMPPKISRVAAVEDKLQRQDDVHIPESATLSTDAESDAIEHRKRRTPQFEDIDPENEHTHKAEKSEKKPRKPKPKPRPHVKQAFTDSEPANDMKVVVLRSGRRTGRSAFVYDESEEAESDCDESESFEASNEDEDEGEDEEDEQDVKKIEKKKRSKGVKKGREDVAAARKTKAVSGTPSVNMNKRKAAEITGNSDGEDVYDQEWNSIIKRRADRKKKKRMATLNADDDTMFQYGGIVADDETDKVEATAVGTGQRPSKKYSMIEIKPNPDAMPKTLKEARGGDKNWKLKHLPDNTEAAFMNEVVPSAWKKVGSLEPWAPLDVKHVQEIVDKVFKDKEYKVTEDNVWFRLAKNCIENWRNGFAQSAMESVDSLIEELTQNNGMMPPTKEAIADEIAFQLENTILKDTPEYTYRTYSYQWRDWSEERVNRKGFGQNPLVLATFANAHLTHIEGPEDSESERPIGALIMSMQAVGRALEYWKTGERPKKEDERAKLSAFSRVHYGDKFERDENSKQHMKRIRRATIFVRTLEAMKDEEWKLLIQAARDYLPDSKKRSRGFSASTSATLVDESRINDPEGEFVMEV